MNEQEFRTKADDALSGLYRRLIAASGNSGFEADFNAGALTVEFDDSPAKFVVSPNAPVQQIWVSAHSKSYKLPFNPDANEFALPDTHQTLTQLIAAALSEELGEPVKL